jgi:hypothetical protein
MEKLAQTMTVFAPDLLEQAGVEPMKRLLL